MIDFSKAESGLIPAVIQDSQTLQVLMVGYMNQEAYEETIKRGKVVFFSRSKNRLWEKGETTANYLYVENHFIDCDNDTILIMARPAGPTCHSGAVSCFDGSPASAAEFLRKLQTVISSRIESGQKDSYTAALHKEGLERTAQKVGEEGVETVIAALCGDKEKFLNESADLVFHLLVLLLERGVTISEVCDLLRSRHVSIPIAESNVTCEQRSKVKMEVIQDD